MSTELKKVIIVGGGLVGQTLASKLAYDGLDVAVIESDPSRSRDLRDELDVEVLCGNGATVPLLREAGIENASLVVASTDSDETNVTVGFVATHVFHVECVVIQVRDEAHEEGFRAATEQIPGRHTCVNPDLAAVRHIFRLLEVPSSLDVMHFLDGELLVAAFRIEDQSDFAGLQVADMKLLFASSPTLVVAINRDTSWTVPSGSDKILSGDIVYFAIARDELQDVLSLVGVPEDPRRRILIAGATPVGVGLARLLEEKNRRVVLIEEDESLAVEAANQLGDTLVIHGRVTDQAVLIEEEIEKVATYVAVTEDHETNLVSGLVAKRLGAGRAFALVDNPALVSLVNEIGIDAVVSRRLLTIGMSLEYIRGAGVRSGGALIEDEVEVVEVGVVGGSRLTAGPLAEVGFPAGMLVVAIQRAGVLQVPHGNDCVQPGDRVVIVVATRLVGRVSEFL